MFFLIFVLKIFKSTEIVKEQQNEHSDALHLD